MEDDYDADFIIDGMKHGFDILDVDDMQEVKFAELENHKFVLGPNSKHIVECTLKEEILLVHYQVATHKPRIVKALGAVEKREGSNELRIIFDASRPKDHCLNSYADPDPFTLDTLYTAVAMLGKRWY